MVGDEDEQRVVEPGLAARLRQELADGVVGVFHCSLTPLAGGDVDTPVRVGVRPVIGGCHQLQEERLAGRMVAIGHLQRLMVEILVGHAPGILEAHLGLIDAALIDDAITIAAEEGVHVVEVSAPAIDEDAVVALRAQLLAQAGIAGLAADALDDGAPRGRRYRQGQRLQTAVGARTRGIEIGEHQAVLAQLVQVRGQPTGIAKTAQILGTQALDGDQHHVELARLAGVVDHPANVLRVTADEARIGLGHFGAQLLGHRSIGQGGVELLIVQLVVTKRSEELVRAIARQLTLVGIATQATRRVLPHQAAAQPDQQCQHHQCIDRTQPWQTRRLQRRTQRPAQRYGQADGQDRQQRQQRIDRVGLENVVDDLFGVHEVVHGNEIEAHAELVPEQPFGHRGE